MRNEKKTEFIHDALNFLDEEIIEDVEKLRGFIEKEEGESGLTIQNKESFIKILKQKAIHGRKLAALAASICLLFVGTWMYEAYIQPAQNHEQLSESSDENVIESQQKESIVEMEADNLSYEADRIESGVEESLKSDYQGAVGVESLRKGVSIPRMEVSLKQPEDDVAVDMLGFFIHNGRSYIQYELHTDYAEEGANFVGKRVGSVTGLIDEWTKDDGYVDGASTYTGDIYEVKGASPEFMLCMVWENGWVETFINHNDITLYKGSDLVDEWLDLRDNVAGLSYETSIDSKIAYGKITLSQKEMDVFQRFLDAFAEGDFVYVEEKLEHPFGGDHDTPDMMDFYLLKEDGLRVRFRTLGDGYVCFPWLDACIQINKELYDELVDTLMDIKTNYK